MKEHDAVFLLNEAILLKEGERAEELILLKAQFKISMESFKPINLLKETFSGAGAEGTVLDTAIGMTSGFIAKKVITGSSKSPLIRIIASIVGTGVGNLAAKHPGGIKAIGAYIFNALSARNKPVQKKT
jgi:hypothetical protein